MGKVVKYKSRINGQILNELDLSGVKWGDGSEMTVKECFERFPKAYDVIEEIVITDQEREEIFDFAKQIVLAQCHGGIDIDQIGFIHKSIKQAKELYRLKDTI